MDADDEVLMAKFVREGKQDILLFNWQAHPKLATTLATQYGRDHRRMVSADFITSCRKQVEEATGCLAAYFTGAAGNLNPVSAIAEENVVPPLDHVAHGKALAKYCINAADAFVPAKFGPIRAKHADHRAKIDHSTDRLVGKAKEITDYYAATNDRDGATRMAREKCGLSSVYHAMAVQERAKLPKTDVIPADVLTVGELAFVMSIYEMFDTNGMEIKKASPFPMTFVLTTANMPEPVEYYLPTRQTFEHGSYASDTCPFCPGIGEEMAALYIELLNKIAKE